MADIAALLCALEDADDENASQQESNYYYPNAVVEKDDWRLTAGPVLGNEEKFKNIPLYYIPFKPLSENWDHEHCAFCWAKFYLHEECLREGYCTRPQNTRDSDWICPECYEDFKEMFGWTLKKEAGV